MLCDESTDSEDDSPLIDLEDSSDEEKDLISFDIDMNEENSSAHEEKTVVTDNIDESELNENSENNQTICGLINIRARLSDIAEKMKQKSATDQQSDSDSSCSSEINNGATKMGYSADGARMRSFSHSE